MSLFPNQALTEGPLLTLCVFFVCSIFVTAKYSLQLLLGQGTKRRWRGRIFGAAASLLVLWIAVDFICVLHSDEKIRASTAFPWISLTAVSIAAIASWLHFRFPGESAGVRSIRLAPALWLLLAISFVTSTWSGYRFYAVAQPHPEVDPDLIPPGQPSRTTDFVAVTDLGRQIPLMEWVVDPVRFARFDFTKLFVGSPASSAAIPRSAPDHNSNCHGWVFTGGRFHLAGNGVQSILEDNGYQVVSQPQAEDLVIYRNSQDGIVHTGLVRGVLDDGTVMVESKWSVSGRFLHRSEDQPYSQNFSYYRSHRLWHVVAIESVPENAETSATASTSTGDSTDSSPIEESQFSQSAI